MCSAAACLSRTRSVPRRALPAFEALRVPSARHDTSTNIVVIYDQMLTTSRVAIHDPRRFAAGTATEVVGEKTSRFKPGR